MSATRRPGSSRALLDCAIPLRTSRIPLGSRQSGERSNSTTRRGPQYTRTIPEQAVSAYDVPDGYSLYRALARHLIGTPERYLEIRDAVISFMVRVRSNPQHPLRGEFDHQEGIFDAAVGPPLFSALDCPDIKPSQSLLWVVAHALKIRLEVYSRRGDDDPFLSAGTYRVGHPTYGTHGVYANDSGPPPIRTIFSAAYDNQSGKQLIEFLEETKAQMMREQDLPEQQHEYRGLNVRRMAWVETPDGVQCCLNEYNTEQPRDVPHTSLSRLDAYVATVYDPLHLESACDLLRTAIHLAPYQQARVRVSEDCNWGTMLPHVSIDGEFVKLPRSPPAGFEVPTVDNGGLEELCSVLTIAVGRHFFLVVNIVHMLENPNEHTVPALAAFYERTLFNPNYLKLWWNPGSDISVLDNTIAHMYQATPRPNYQHTPWQSTGSITITPRFRIHSTYFDGHRPNNLRFPAHQVVCDLHAQGANERGIFCTCRLGNIDLATLLNHFCRTHGKPTAALRWDRCRHGFNYSQLLSAMLGSDRLYPVLNFMKDRADASPDGKDAFYQDLGSPRMVRDDDAMAYIIGDVAGQNLIFEQTVFSDDVQLVGSSLEAYNVYLTDPTRRPKRLRDQCVTQHSWTDTGVLLIEDIPLVHGKEPYKPEDRAEGRRTNDCFWRTERLRPWEHDRRVLLGRQHPLATADGRRPKSQAVPYRRPEEVPGRTLRMWPFLNDLYDPRKFWVPPTCATVDQQPLQPEYDYDDPVVRAGTTHMEALIEFLQSPQAATASPPNGFGAPPGSRYGLPTRVRSRYGWPTQLGRTPGESLQHPRNIYDAFQGGPKPYGSRLGGIVRTHQDSLTLQPNANINHEIQSAINRAGDLSLLENRLGLQEMLLQARIDLDHEREQNTAHGLPSRLDTSDPYDPEGRELRRRYDAAAPWNQPLQPYFPPAGVNGAWRSQASDTIAAFQLHTTPAMFALIDDWDRDRIDRARRRRNDNVW